MEAGKHVSPIVLAIAEAEDKTTAEIRVHVSERYYEPNPLARAQRMFERLGMHQTEARNAVLLYVNLKRRKLAIYGDLKLHERLGDPVWKKIIEELRDDLLGTHPERAIALGVDRIGAVLGLLYPRAKGAKNPNELPNDVSRD